VVRAPAPTDTSAPLEPVCCPSPEVAAAGLSGGGALAPVAVAPPSGMTFAGAGADDRRALRDQVIAYFDAEIARIDESTLAFFEYALRVFPQVSAICPHVQR